MAATAAGSSRPGVAVGPTSEFSLFFRVKPGEGEALRDALHDLQDTPGYRPGDYGMAISTIHEARFVLFDDDTRLAFVTSFDGPWDAYMEDFFTSGPTLALFDVIFRHAEGYDGLPDLRRGEGVHPRRAADGGRLRTQLPRHGQGDPEGPARQHGLPAGARPPGCCGGTAAPGVEAAAGRGRRLTRSDPPETASTTAYELDRARGAPAPRARRHPERRASRAAVAVRRARTSCSASTTAPPDASWCGDCSTSSTTDDPHPIRPTMPGSRPPSPITG